MLQRIHKVLLLGAVLIPALAQGNHSNQPSSPLPSQPSVLESGSIKGVFTSFERLKTKGATSQKDVVVYLKAKTQVVHAPPKQAAVVVQEKLNFSPHVLPILKGTKVEYSNIDAVAHNVFSADSCCAVDSDMDAGKKTEVTYSEAGITSVVCRLHPDMSLWVLVLDNPWFKHIELEKVKDDDGSRYSSEYAIADVPPGTYELTFWNKKLKPISYEVTIAAGAATEFNVEIPK